MIVVLLDTTETPAAGTGGTWTVLEMHRTCQTVISTAIQQHGRRLDETNLVGVDVGALCVDLGVVEGQDSGVQSSPGSDIFASVPPSEQRKW